MVSPLWAIILHLFNELGGRGRSLLWPEWCSSSLRSEEIPTSAPIHLSPDGTARAEPSGPVTTIDAERAPGAPRIWLDRGMRLPLGRGTLVARAKAMLFATVGLRERLIADAEVLGGLGPRAFYHAASSAHTEQGTAHNTAQRQAVLEQATADYRRTLQRAVRATEEALAAGATRTELGVLADELGRLLWHLLPRSISARVNEPGPELETPAMLERMRLLQAALREAPQD